MRIIRYADEAGKKVTAALTDEGTVYPLPYAGLVEIVRAADAAHATASQLVSDLIGKGLQPLGRPVEQLELLVPLEAPEVWAAGVTYERSRDARNYEATEGKMDALTVYDKVYDAVRPELFFKSTAARTAGPGQALSLRSDSGWQIPEPELGLVLDGNGRILGYTIGNDMSCRDIEGENPLYLPQAKIWKGSCAIGPAVRLADTVNDPYALGIVCRIYRGGEGVVEGRASTGQLKRRLDELVSFLLRDNEIFDGTVLLTGTCIVPPNDFTLAEGDQVEIEIDGIGKLINPIRSKS